MNEDLFKNLKFDKQLRAILFWLESLTTNGLKIAKDDITKKIEELENKNE